MILWDKKTPHTHYEVRRAGNSLRLYSNNVFHSQFNPRSPIGGHVWDLLFLPALYTTTPIKRVLLLGVGGGAVIRQLNYFLQPDTILGIELDKQHIQIAKRFFGLGTASNVELIHADAIGWLKSYRGPGFDLVIDDLFSHSAKEAKRAIAVDSHWARALTKVLSPRGVLVVNFESQSSLAKSALVANNNRVFKSSWRFSIKGFDNRIGAFFKGAASRDSFIKRKTHLSEAFGASAFSRLNANVRRIS